MKVLVVDDKLQDAFPPLEMTFQSEGIEVEWVKSGLDALKLLDEEHSKINAVLIDLAMPAISGLETITQIRENEKMYVKKPVKIAYFTARQVGDVEKDVAVESSVDRVFTKPYSPIELVKEVKQWLEV